MRYAPVEVTLIEHSTAGNQPRTFSAQSVEIVHEPDTVVTSVDCKVSRGRHPSKIVWMEGKASYLAAVTNVRVVGSKGEILIDGWDVNRTFDPPRDTAKGVEFAVLKAD